MCTGALWGCIGPMAKVAYSEGMGAMEVAFWRTALAWICFAAHALFSRKVKVDAHDIPYLLGFGILGVAGMHGFYCLAVRDGGAALSAVLLYTAPAWVVLMAFIFLKERLSPVKVLAVSATVAGVICVSQGQALDFDTSLQPGAVVFGLASGFCYALYYIFGKRLIRYPTPTVLLYALPAAAVTLWPWTSFTFPSVKGMAACLGLAVISTYIAFLVYYLGLKQLEAGRAVVAATCEPVVAGFLAYVFFGEVFGPWGYLGSALIIGAVLLSAWDSVRVGRLIQPPEPM